MYENMQREKIIYLLKEILVELKLQDCGRDIWDGIERKYRSKIDNDFEKIEDEFYKRSME